MSSSNAECSTKPKAPEGVNKEQVGPRRTTVQQQQLPPRPKLVPTYPSAEARIQPSCNTDDDDAAFLPFYLSGLPVVTSQEVEDDEQWTSVITAPAYAPLESWSNVMQSLIRHPERNSSNILRADIVSETTTDDHLADVSKSRSGWKKQWTIRRSLLPRRPNLDWSMLQDCSLFHRYRRSAGRVKEEEHQDEEGEAEIVEAVVVYTPLIGDLDHPKMNITEEEASTCASSPPSIGHPPPTESYIPFYHPKVRALAFHFHPSSPSASSSAHPDHVYGHLSISLVPFSPSNFPPTHRLSRVALSLLTTLHMHTWGHLHSYRKRVHHDTLIPRSLYQDLYLSLKGKHASALIRNWKEATDPSKHVFEEMGIAAFLIGLWTQQYGGEGDWRGKVRFVDVGCGNGLLTYILTKEGFRGVGLDMRARKSWAGYIEDGAKLREWNFNPASLLSSNDDDDEWKGAWLIGNHADQLTPWIPLLATHHRAQGFINLPCCYYALDGTRDFPLLLKGEPGETLSRNEQYLAYISKLHQESGWEVELDPLRIPSTKNWCFVGRHKQFPALDDPDLKNRFIQAIEKASLGAWSLSTTTHTSSPTQLSP